MKVNVQTNTYRLAMPAFLTAVEIALIAVHIELRRVVNSPVPLAFLPSSNTKRVRVTTLVSKALLSDISAAAVFLLVCVEQKVGQFRL